MKDESRSTLEAAASWVAILAAVVGVYGAVKALRAARRSPGIQPGGRRPRVVILGAGFAGLEVARTLGRLMPDRCEIVLIDRHNYQLFTPLLFQVATCGVDPYSITYPVRELTEHRSIAFRAATVSNIDLDRRRVTLRDQGEMGFDYLVIALGSTTNYFGIHSAQEHALPLKTVGDAIAIRNHVLDALERASQASVDERERLLTFVIVGGGSTGVETAAALSELLGSTVPVAYPDIGSEEPRIVLLEGSGRLLGHMRAPAAEQALARLKEMGIEIWLNTRARDVRPAEIVAEDGRSLSARTMIWTTGVRARDVVASMDAAHDEDGSLVVDQYLRVRGNPGVYAIGDCAHAHSSITGESVPWLAASAVQEGAAAARNIARAIQGLPQSPFEYRDQGTLVSLGRSDGLAQFGRLVITGPLGTLLWHLVHLAKIPTMRDRISTALDWSAGYVHDKDTTRLEVWPDPQTRRDAPGPRHQTGRRKSEKEGPPETQAS